MLFALALGSMDEAEQMQRLLVRLLAPPSVAPLQPIPEQSPVGRLEPIPVRPRLAAHLLAKAFARWLIYRAGLRAIQRLTGVWLFLGHPRIPSCDICGAAAAATQQLRAVPESAADHGLDAAAVSGNVRVTTRYQIRTYQIPDQ